MERTDTAAGAARADNARLNMREFADQAEVLRSMPTKAWLSVTGKCNLLCTHCPRSLIDEQFLSSDEITATLFADIQRDLFPSLDMLRIGGNNLGEQLFARSWPTYAREMSHQPYTPWLVTNAQTMNQSRIADLVEAGYIIDISIDGATEDRYRLIRGASLAKLTDNVRSIIRERQRWDETAAPGARRAKVIFSFTAFADNVDEVPKLVRLAADLGVDEVVVTHYMPSLEEQRYQSLFYHQNTANAAFADARRIADETGVAVQLPPAYLVRSLGSVEALRVRVRDRYGRELDVPGESAAAPKCLHPWTSASINEKGEVYPCCQSNLLMGDLKTSSFAEIWNNRRYRKLRRTVNSDNPLPDCRQCVLRGESFTSVGCEEGRFFLRNLDLPNWHTDTRRARLREWFAQTKLGRWFWNAGRSVYKNFLEWHFAR